MPPRAERGVACDCCNKAGSELKTPNEVVVVITLKKKGEGAEPCEGSMSGSTSLTCPDLCNISYLPSGAAHASPARSEAPSALTTITKVATASMATVLGPSKVAAVPRPSANPFVCEGLPATVVTRPLVKLSFRKALL